MLQRLSHLPHISLSESSVTNLIDDSALNHDKGLLSPPIDQSSIRFPSTDIYHYDSSSSNSSASSAPSDELHIIIPRSRRLHGSNSSTASVSHPSSPTPSSIKSRNNSRVRGQAGTIRGGLRTPDLSDTSDVDTARPLHELTQASHNVGGVKRGSLGAQPCQFSSEMRASSLPHLDSHVRAQSSNLNVSPQTYSIRKKSGELIKPSLKRAKLPSLSMPTGGGVVQSEPSTPTLSKSVHFDAKLEHVKLFLTKQKPLAVSRDHDPPTDTSGTESDFSSFVHGLNDCPEKQIELQIQNMPAVQPKGADVVLKELTLSQSDKTIVGRVCVRNIAYEKWVAARFTLDLWQTTSEVTALYTESVDGGSFDIFTFSIRLHHIWPRIEEKTMLIALRYSVADRQIWDNNNGANYMVKFVQKPAARKASAATELIMDDLSAKVKLASVDTDPLQISPSLRSTPTSTPKTSLSARYHLDSALKIPGGGTGGGTLPPLRPRGTRTHTYPTELSSIWSKHVLHPVEKIPPRHNRSVTIGSPRDLEKHEQARIVRSDSVAIEFPLSMPQSQAGRERNHRRGYSDRPTSGMPRKTPSLFSLPEEQLPTHGNDPVKGIPSLFERFTAQTLTRVSSEGSAASAMSDLSSRSTPLTSSGPDTPDSKPSPNDSYSQFLNQ